MSRPSTPNGSAFERGVSNSAASRLLGVLGVDNFGDCKSVQLAGLAQEESNDEKDDSKGSRRWVGVVGVAVEDKESKDERLRAGDVSGR